MRNRIDVKDKNNMLIGWCEDNGSEVLAFHLRKGFVGRYVKGSNITFDGKGNRYCFGDGTQSLVRDADRM